MKERPRVQSSNNLGPSLEEQTVWHSHMSQSPVAGPTAKLESLKDAVNTQLANTQKHVRRKSRLVQSHGPEDSSPPSQLPYAAGYPFPVTKRLERQPSIEQHDATPSEFTAGQQRDNLAFPAPNIYKLTLTLNSEAGLDSFWSNCVEIFMQHFRASKLALAFPSDRTDIHGTPWGLKALYESNGIGNEIVSPSIPKSQTRSSTPDQSEEWESDEVLEQFSDRWSPTLATPGKAPKRRMMDKLLSLDDLEKGLIDNSGIQRVLKRGEIVIVSRQYTGSGATALAERRTHCAQTRPSLPLRNPSNGDIDTRAFRAAVYEEYEQPPLSPWSHSPAPSPAIIKVDKDPFFDSPTIDLDSFSPKEPTPLYSSPTAVNAIGYESAHSIIHIPLIHPSAASNVDVRPSGHKSNVVPIAILSFLSTVIPYPPSLVRSLAAFAPIIATSLSQALSHANILHQLSSRPSGSYEGRPKDVLDDLNSLPRSSPTTSANSTPNWDPITSVLSPLSSWAENGDDPFTSQHTSFQNGMHDDIVAAKRSHSPPKSIGVHKASGFTSEEKQTTPVARSHNRLRSPSSSPKVQVTASVRRKPIKPPHRHRHSRIHSYGACVESSFSSLIGTRRPRLNSDPSSEQNNQQGTPAPSANLLQVIIDCIPVHVYTAMPQTGSITWMNSRGLEYRGQTRAEFNSDVWASIHEGDLKAYTRTWKHAIRKSQPFSSEVRIRRFDGVFRWFLVRAVPLRDTKFAVVNWLGTNMDVHEQKLQQRDTARQLEMEASESKYRRLAEASPSIVFAASHLFGITYANAKWFSFSGLNEEQTKHLGFMANVHADDRPKCILPSKTENPDQSFPWPSQLSTEVRLKDSYGVFHWHLVQCTWIEEIQSRDAIMPSQQIWFGTCTDINDQKLLEQRLKEANEASQRTMEAKTRFLSNMSHEIRTPLIGISGMVNFLLDTPLTAEQLDYCHTISSSSDALLMVINDVLDMAKVDAGMMRLASEWFYVRSLVEDANELLCTMSISKNLELNYVVDENVPQIINGDRIRIRQVLLNIIGNAIKFTTEGEVFSYCSLAHDSSPTDDSVLLQFECHDTGAGFSKDEEELMFKPFSQVDSSSTRKHGGSGLGLVISRQLVELHGGQISCRSEKGTGSTFKFTARFGVSPTDRTRKLSSSTDPGVSTDFQKLYSPTVPLSKGHSFKTFETGSGWPASLCDTSYPDPSAMNFRLPAEIEQRIQNYNNQSQSNFKTGNGIARPVLSTHNSTGSMSGSVATRTYTILIVSQMHFGRIAIQHHINLILPKSATNKIVVAESIESASIQLDVTDFTHVVVNFHEDDKVVRLLSKIKSARRQCSTTVLVLATPVQRSAICSTADYNTFEDLDLKYVFKPLKPSRFSAAFDPGRESRESTDLRRKSAQLQVDQQKFVFNESRRDLGGRGLRVLLVEDNAVNQKVSGHFPLTLII